MPYAVEAHRFREEMLARGQVRLIALDSIDLQVLDALAADLSPIHLAATIGGLLYDDVVATFEILVTSGLLQLVNPRAVARSAFVTAGLFDLPLADALSVALTEAADQDGYTLLVCDDMAYQRLRALQVDRPTWRLAWLPEYIQP